MQQKLKEIRRDYRDKKRIKVYILEEIKGGKVKP